MRTGTAIIGGGAIGLSIAWELAAAGEAVAVIDGRSAVPRATKAAAGMLAPSFEGAEPHLLGGAPAALRDFSLASLRAWPGYAEALREASGIDVDYRPEGVLGVALDEAGAERLAAQAAAMEAAGVTSERLDAKATREFEPHLSEAVIGGLFALEEGQVDPILLVAALEAAARRAGAEVRQGVVARLTPEKGALRLTLASGGLFFADRVVVAAGAGVFAEAAGMPPGVVQPVKGDALALKVADARGPSRVIRGAGAYICPKSDGRIVIGATEVSGHDRLDPDANEVARLRARAERIAPLLARAHEASRWAGLRPGTPDAAPVIGPLSGRDERIIFAVGHYRNGVLLAPATARMVAERLLGGTGDWPAAFSPDRFLERSMTPDRKLR
ncbi:MAG: glycine oxidase ThiO [Pseudomonadota bacterium]